jgi:tetraprenyl-beta-curcumene synthase
VYLAMQPRVDARAIESTVAAYFPNVSAVHILLDYFIDQAEDREHAELNFVACYPSSAVAVERVGRLVRATSERLRALRHGEWHEFVLRAMCLFYLTHPKVYEQRLDRESAAVLAAL